MKYVYKKVDYYSMQQLMDLIEQLKNEYQVIGYEAYAQKQYAVLTLYPKKEENQNEESKMRDIQG